MELAHRERPAAKAAEGRTAIVLLHSRAGDEQEMLPLLEELDPEARHLGLLPLGPLQTDEGRHWYSIEREASPEPETFLPSLRALSAWLGNALTTHGLEIGHVVLGGFSQGAVMAYALGLARGHPSPAAILAFSGYIPRVEGFELDLEGRAGLSVAVAHGSRDPTVGIGFGREARARFEGSGLEVRYVEESVGHEITPAALDQARTLLADVLR